MPHTCHAHDCPTRVPEAMFMCRGHWFRLPKEMRDRVWAAYVPGQEIDKTPSREYLEVAREAIDWLKEKTSA